MKTYHSAITGKFVTKEYAEANPDTTVALTNIDLRNELINFFMFLRENGEANIEMSIQQFVDEYLKSK